MSHEEMPAGKMTDRPAGTAGTAMPDGDTTNQPAAATGEEMPRGDMNDRPIEPARPKRGAFPTPKSEIEKAKPFIPDPRK